MIDLIADDRSIRTAVPVAVGTLLSILADGAAQDRLLTATIILVLYLAARFAEQRYNVTLLGKAKASP